VSDDTLPEETSGPELPVTSGPSDARIREAAAVAGGHRVSVPGATPDAPPAGAGRGRSAERPGLDFWKALYERRTTRRFDPSRPVPREIVLELLDAALIAPTSCNLQMWDFIVVDDPDQREKLGRLSLQVLTAPVTILVAYEESAPRAAAGSTPAGRRMPPQSAGRRTPGRRPMRRFDRPAR
jgi:hypothetical protein